MKIPGRGWAYVGAVLGGVVSIAANVAHSYVPPKNALADWAPQGGAVLGAVFWPVALFVAIEILARVVWPDGRRWVALRWLGLVPVAVVAAVVSYLHLSGLLAFYGEDTLTVVFGPLAVDGLMVMATGALIATGRQRAAEPVTVAAASDTLPGIRADTRPATAADIRPAIEPAPQRPAARPAKTAKAATDTAGRVAKLAAKTPDITPAIVAAKLEISERTARRHLSAIRTDSPADNTPATVPDTPPVNGHPVPALVDVH